MTNEAVILVVDDQPDLLQLLSFTLKSVGYRVLTANDGVEALDVLESQPVDLILADIAMPRMSGYHLFEHVVKNPEWVSIPFVFLTARALDSDIRYGKGLGADDYLTKPIEPEDLLAVVRGKLRRVRQLAERSAPQAQTANSRPRMMALGSLRVDAIQHRAWLNGRQVKLSSREFLLLERLARQANTVIPLQELVKSTHDLETDRADAGVLLRPLVRSLRRKLGYPAGEMGCIETVRCVGYRLIPQGESMPVASYGTGRV